MFVCLFVYVEWRVNKIVEYISYIRTVSMLVRTWLVHGDTEGDVRTWKTVPRYDYCTVPKLVLHDRRTDGWRYGRKPTIPSRRERNQCCCVAMCHPRVCSCAIAVILYMCILFMCGCWGSFWWGQWFTWRMRQNISYHIYHIIWSSRSRDTRMRLPVTSPSWTKLMMLGFFLYKFLYFKLNTAIISFMLYTTL